MADREAAAVAAITEHSFRVVDRLPCVAPIADMAGSALIRPLYAFISEDKAFMWCMLIEVVVRT